MNPDTFTATHIVGDNPLETRAAPNPALPANNRLDPRLEVVVDNTLGAWSHVVCSNGWSAWVDGAGLYPVGQAPPPPAAPTVAMPAAAITPAAAALPSAAVSPTAGGAAAFGPTTWLALLGGGLAALSTFLSWIQLTGFGIDFHVDAFKLPLAALLDFQKNVQSSGDPGLFTAGLVMLAAGILALVLVFVPTLDLIRRACGVVAVVVPSLVVYQLQKLPHVPGQPSGMSFMGIGVPVAAVAGLLVLVGSARKTSPAA